MCYEGRLLTGGQTICEAVLQHLEHKPHVPAPVLWIGKLDCGFGDVGRRENDDRDSNRY